MFKLSLYDRKGNELKEGDFVKISNGREFTFFAEVKYLENEKIITPFHTFSFMSFEKVDSIPENSVKSSEERYQIWYLPNPENDNDADEFNRYLLSWRQCEDLIEKKCFRIEKL